MRKSWHIDSSKIERLSENPQYSEMPRRSASNATLVDKHMAPYFHLDFPDLVLTYLHCAMLIQGEDASNHMLSFL